MKRAASALFHIGSAIAFTLLVLLALSLYSRLRELRGGLDNGFDVVGTYQNIDQNPYAAVELSIDESDTSETGLIWRARDLSEGSDAANELGQGGIVEATADPNGFYLLADDGGLAATLHLSPAGSHGPTGSHEKLVLFLDLLNRGDLLEFNKVASSVVKWEE